MTPRVRVLVVDDSVVVRRLVCDALAAAPDIEIAGTAANGRIALQKLFQLQPDVVTLDVEMPEMDGLETLKHLRQTHPRLPVIMFSTLTQRGAEATLDALARGANDYVTKPANVGSVTAAVERVREELLPKIRALAPLGPVPPGPALPGRAPIARVPRVGTITGTPFGTVSSPEAPRTPVTTTSLFSSDSASGVRPVEIVAIGVSTGGPNALATILPALPATFPVPLVIVQHMPPMFTRLLAERLDAQAAIRVEEATDGRELEPGVALIAPGDFHMRLARRGAAWCAALDREPPENSCRPAVDPLFQSAADAFGASTLAVVLTGMGHDGLRGCEHVRGRHGQVFVQDEATSVVWGMPGFVARAGLAQRTLALDAVAGAITRAVAAGRALRTAG